MYIKKKGQQATEFMIVLIFVLALISVVMYITGVYMTEIQEQDKEKTVKNFVESIENEIEIMNKAEDGYYRELVIPSTSYDVDFNNSKIYVKDLKDDNKTYEYDITAGLEFNVTTKIDEFSDNVTVIIFEKNEQKSEEVKKDEEYLYLNSVQEQFYYDCTGPDGSVIVHGDSEIYFQSSSVPSGNSCVGESRLCDNGVLGGSYTYTSCSINCLGPDSVAIDHGDSRTYYQSSSVPFGDSCVSESRTCSNGVLDGSFQFATCGPLAPNNCVESGVTVSHDTSRLFYLSGTVPFGSGCISQSRYCYNGNLDGNYTNPNCYENCLGPDGSSISHGSSKVYYQSSSVPFGSSCVSQSRVCSDGSLSGSYTFTSCSVAAPSSCSLPWGGSISHGSSVTAYSTNSVPFGSSCSSYDQTRTCSNGVLSGSYQYQSCSVSAAPASCNLPWGGSISHGSSVTAYSTNSVPYGSSCSSYDQTRTCSDGTLSGSYQYQSCSVDSPQNCIGPDGSFISHGSSKTYYLSSSGSTCTSQSRTCSDGTLSGSYQYSSCSPTIFYGISCDGCERYISCPTGDYKASTVIEDVDASTYSIHVQVTKKSTGQVCNTPKDYFSKSGFGQSSGSCFGHNAYGDLDTMYGELISVRTTSGSHVCYNDYY